MIRRGTSVMLCFIGFGCSERTFAGLPLEAGALLVAAYGDVDGHVDKVEPKFLESPIEVSEGASAAFVFALSDADFVGSDGTSPLDAVSLVLRADQDPQDSCRACLLPGGEPQYLEAGDLCSLPQLGEAFGLILGEKVESIEDESILEAVRGQIQVAMKGPCVRPSLEPYELPENVRVDVRTVFNPGDQAWLAEYVDPSEDGIDVLGPGTHAFFSSYGEPSLQRASPTTDDILGLSRRTDQLLVMSRESRRGEPGSRPGRARFDLLNPDGTSQEVPGGIALQRTLEASHLLDVPADVAGDWGAEHPYTVLLVGLAAGNESSAVELCSSDSATSLGECVLIGSLGGRISSIRILPDGRILAGHRDSSAAVSLGVHFAGAWNWTRHPVLAESGDLVQDWVEDLLVFEDVIFACTQDGSLFTHSVTGDDTYWKHVADHPPVSCSFSDLPEFGTVVLWPGIEALSLAQSMVEVPLPDRSVLYSRRVGNTWYTIDGCGALSSRTGTAAQQALYGATVPEEGCIQALAEYPDGSVFAFLGRFRARFLGDRWESEPLVGFDGPVRVRVVVPDRTKGDAAFLVPESEPRVYVIEGAQRVHTIELPGVLVDAAEIEPGVLFAATNDALLLIDRDGYDAWQVPEAGSRLACLRDVDAREGIGYAGGSCGLRRIFTRGGVPRVDVIDGVVRPYFISLRQPESLLAADGAAEEVVELTGEELPRRVAHIESGLRGFVLGTGGVFSESSFLDDTPFGEATTWGAVGSLQRERLIGVSARLTRSDGSLWVVAAGKIFELSVQR